MTAATYMHGTAILAGPSVVEAPVQGVGVSAEHGAAKAAGQWLACVPQATETTAVASIALTPICAALRAQTAQDLGTGTAVFGGGSFSAETGSPVVIADDKPNFRTGRLSRDRQPV